MYLLCKLGQSDGHKFPNTMKKTIFHSSLSQFSSVTPLAGRRKQCIWTMMLRWKSASTTPCSTAY